MIPKTIHYCWFGGNPKPKLAEKCIKSWKKYCPDYKIIEWNETNFDISSAPLYVRQAYESKKWAFVTDYVRLYALVNYGGIYMDTDVEVVKALDIFLKHDAFSGFEDEKNIPTGIMGCKKDFPLFMQFLNYYNDAEFYNGDGSLNLTTNVTVITNICSQNGFIPNNQYQEMDGFAIYPNDYFCPLDFRTRLLKKTKNTATIHWFSASWHDDSYRERRKKHLKLKRRQRSTRLIKKIAISVLGQERFNRLKTRLRK